MLRHTKKFLVQLIKILLSAAIIFWMIQSGKLNFSALKNLLSPAPLAVGFLLIFLNVYLGSERWKVLIRSQGIRAQSYATLKLTLIGAFFNFAMPGGVGGDVIKAYYFNRENTGNKVVAVTSVLIDRVLGLYSMVLMALVVMIYDIEHVLKIPALTTLFWFILLLFSGFSIGLTLVFSQVMYTRGILKKLIQRAPLSDKILKAYESMHLYGKDLKRIAYVIILSLIGQACSVLFLALVGNMAGFVEVSTKTYFLVAPIGFMATAIPISPAGVGVGQAAFYFLFNIYTGTTTELGPTCITAFQVGTFILSLTGAFYYLRRKDRAEASKISANSIS